MAMEYEYLITPAAAARLLNASTNSLINWEQKGLLTTYRTAGGHRRYHFKEVQKLRKKQQRG